MIKFQKFAVVSTETGFKARASYAVTTMRDGRECVTIYAKDYGSPLGAMFDGGEYENNTDSQTDYFETGRVRLFPGHPLYGAARERAEANEAAWRAKYSR